MKKIIIVANPTAGHHSQSRIARFTRHLAQAGLPASVAHTHYPGHATILARDAAESGLYSHIVAAGGDGTIAEVSAGMVGTSAILGILPLGSANVLAHELRIPFNEIRNAALIRAGHFTTIWPGYLHTQAGPQLFVQMASIGFDAHIVHTTSTRLKARIGRAAYAVSTLSSLLRYGLTEFTVLIDTVPHRATTVIVSKGSLYAGKYALTRHSAHKDKKFSVILFETSGKLALMKTVLSLFLGRIGRQKGVRTLTAATVQVPSPAAIPIQSDGDRKGFSPACLDISPSPLRVAVTPAG
ncbi:diacylglycerol/lipid kinase family protein [Gluconacetobacter takamatsuzukensis]|uniref:Diacylglycerol kinase family lipid kinase n=1 Tax=Gluconacetobacter takamatsuzukensis TaxID=1286190 RepID=A0A7W4KB23_9PROT|nr:diacylglycerol kinase family protein [Gluconacetobacter takamatsuzukensis]MBB2203639.1 diacylglycerol kinase family lipid kinase [Gluconacetobacter takamatsuzukensis]